MQGHNSALTERSQELRRLKNATKQEKHLWFDYLRQYRPKFRRQVVIDQFIVDFYCPKVKLVVELDGLHHFSEEFMAYDGERTAILEGLGCCVIRYTNDDIDHRFQAVCADIDQWVQKLLQEPFPPPTW